MNSQVFEDWFENKLLPNLDRNTVIFLVNVSYHFRILEKISNTSTRKDEIINFMKKHSITIPQPIHVKAVLFDLVNKANLRKKFVVDSLAEKHGHIVVRLPPYHCVFNPIEMAWNQMKHNVRHHNIYSNQPEKVMQLIKDACQEITPQNWENYISDVEKSKMFTGQEIT